MTGLSAAFDAALAQDAVPLWWAVEITLNTGQTVRLLTASDQISFSGKTFAGEDDEFGVVLSIDTISDGLDTQAPRPTIALGAPSLAGAAVLTDPANQNSPVTVWCGSVDLSTGAVIADPDPWFVGEIDVATLKVDAGSRTVELEVSSIFERMFDDDQGALLTNAFHQYLWPGELGLEFVVDVQLEMPWGQDGARPVLVRDVLGGSAASPGSQIGPLGGGGGIFGPGTFNV